MIKRIILGVLFFISVITMPWWLSVSFGILLIFLFRSYYEAIIGGAVMDFLYSIPTEKFMGFQFVFTLIFLFLFALSKILKKYLRYYG